MSCRDCKTFAALAQKVRRVTMIIMDAVNTVADGINGLFAYLQANAWPILFLIGVGYVVKKHGK